MRIYVQMDINSLTDRLQEDIFYQPYQEPIKLKRTVLYTAIHWQYSYCKKAIKLSLENLKCLFGLTFDHSWILCVCICFLVHCLNIKIYDTRKNS